MREFGLIGKSLSHSFSQTYFTQKFHSLELTDCSYELFELADIRELPGMLASHPDLVGLNITIPYKEQVLPFLHDVAPSAARVGAVNVIEITPEGKYIGHNTDYVGFRESLERFYPDRGEDVAALVLGTGGASKAVEVALRDLGIRYWVVSRNPMSKGLTYDDLTPTLVGAHSLIINATPLGTYPRVDEFPPLPYEVLSSQHYLYDLVYNPSETRFLQKGAEAGAHTTNGFEMLCLQAEAAWRIWNK